MAEFKTAFQKTITHEGGYINDPDDKGGETYKSISRASHNNWSGWEMIDKYKNKSGFPANLDKDVELQNQVEIFYLYEFWLPLKADQIQNQMNADSIFDFSVNTGIITSVQLSQSLMGDIHVDGIIGVRTLSKLNGVDLKHFQAAFIVGKIAYYIYIIKKRPTNKKYLYGWVTRALEYNE